MKHDYMKYESYKHNPTSSLSYIKKYEKEFMK